MTWIATPRTRIILFALLALLAASACPGCGGGQAHLPRSGLTPAAAQPVKPARPPAAIRAIGEGKGWRLVVQILDGAGARVEITEGEIRVIQVFDVRKKRSYEHVVNENVVTIETREPGEIREVLRAFTAAGAREEMLEALGDRRGALKEEETVLDGRTLRKIHAPGTEVKGASYVDPATGLLAYLDMDDPSGLRRIRFEYPQAGEMDPELFRFQIPPGARVDDATKEMKGQ